MVGGAKPTSVPSSFLKLRGEFAVMGLDALEALEKIDVKEGAAKLAVGDPLQAHILLGAHDFADARVLDCVQLGGGEAAGGETLTRFPQPLRAKETPDMVGAKRRTGHGSLPRAFLGGLIMCHDGLGVGNRAPSLPRREGRPKGRMRAAALSPHRQPLVPEGRGPLAHRLAAKNARSIAAASLSRKPP